MHFSQETFFRPQELHRELIAIPANLYNRAEVLRKRCPSKHLFVAIRTMQFIAVVDESEILFVDSMHYAVHHGEGGRMILLAWEIPNVRSRDSLTEPVSVELIHYAKHSRELHNRLMIEFPKSLELMESRAQTEQDPSHKIKKVIPFKA